MDDKFQEEKTNKILCPLDWFDTQQIFVEKGKQKFSSHSITHKTLSKLLNFESQQEINKTENDSHAKEEGQITEIDAKTE